MKKPQQNPRPAKSPGDVPAAVKRAVWSRDEGKCQWPVVSGGICGSTLRLQIDHVVPRGKGGPSMVENCRLACAMHNQLAARQAYGDKHMDLFTRSIPMAREAGATAWQPACRTVLDGNGTGPLGCPPARLEARHARHATA